MPETQETKVRVYFVSNTNINRGVFVTNEENEILNFHRTKDNSPCYSLVVDTGSQFYKVVKHIIEPGNKVGISPLQRLKYTRAFKLSGKDSERRYHPEIADLEVMRATTLSKEVYDEFQQNHLKKVIEASSVAAQIAILQHRRKKLFDHLQGKGSIENLLLSHLEWDE